MYFILKKKIKTVNNIISIYNINVGICINYNFYNIDFLSNIFSIYNFKNEFYRRYGEQNLSTI